MTRLLRRLVCWLRGHRHPLRAIEQGESLSGGQRPRWAIHYCPRCFTVLGRYRPIDLDSEFVCLRSGECLEFPIANQADQPALNPAQPDQEAQ